MKQYSFLLLGILLQTSFCLAQRQSYDIASFEPISGWAKEEKGSYISFTKTNSATQTYCVIALYKSMPSAGSLSKDFERDWSDLVAKMFRVSGSAEENKVDPKNGWNVLSRSSLYIDNNKQGVITLITLSNNKQAMSMVGFMNDPSYKNNLIEFYNQLQLTAENTTPQATKQSSASNAQTDFGDYIFEAPPGWVTEKSNGSLILRGPDQSSVLTILPMVASGGNLDQDMETIFWQAFNGWQPDERNPDHHISTKGVSASGWEYLKKEIGLRDVNNEEMEIYGFVFLAKIENRLAVIAGTYNTTTDLLYENSNPDWALFYHSLDFKNFRKASESTLKKDIVGKWLIGSSTGLLTYEFAANGHYSNGSAFSTSHQVSDYKVKETTTSFVGDGTYSIKGNEVTKISGKGKASTEKVRIFYENEYGSWIKTIGLLSKSIVDNSTYEVKLRWQE